MASHSVVKYIVWALIVTHICVFNAHDILAADLRLAADPQMFAQNSSSEAVTSGKEKALQQSYLNKMSRLEREIDNVETWRENILSLSLGGLFAGTSLYFLGGTTVSDAIEDIPGDDPLFLEEKENALESLDSLEWAKNVGGLFAIVGGVGLFTYFNLTANLNRKRLELETTQADLDSYFESQGLTPRYLQQSQSVSAVQEKIDVLKKDVKTSRATQKTLSSVVLASLLSGLSLIFASKLTSDVVKTITIDENDAEQAAARDDALDESDKIETVGFVFLGTSIASTIAWVVFEKRARKTDKQVDELEDSLLGIVERLDIRPRRDGVMVIYTYRF